MLELTDLFVQSPGDFFYHVIVVLSLSAGLGVALSQLTKRPQSRTAVRYSLAVGGALMGWLVLTFGALFAVFARQDPQAILPPIERAVTVTSMLLIGWAFLTADGEVSGGVISVGLFALLLTTIVGYIVTGIRWAVLASIIDFNLSQYGFAWAVVQGVTALFGVLLMLGYFRSIIDAPLKLLFYALLLVGFAGTLWQMASGGMIGSYSGFSRMALFLAAPIVPLVIYRKIVYGYELALDLRSSQGMPPVSLPERPQTAEAEQVLSVSSQPLSKAQVTPQSSPVERESVQLLRTIGLILEEAKPADIPLRIVKAAVEVLKADVGALLDAKDANYADILIAYDRAADSLIPAMLSLNLENQVTLVNAVQRKKQRPLFLDRNPDELKDLYSRLDIQQLGPAYFQPLMRDDELIAILVVALPYAKRELRDAEVELLKGIGIISGSLLALSYAADEAMIRAEERAIHAIVSGVPIDEIDDADVIAARREMQSALDAAREQNRNLQKQVAMLKIELDDERTRLMGLMGDTEQGLTVSQRIVAINEEQERLREERDQLAERLEEAETALTSATGTDNEALFQAQIEQLDREKRDLTAELESLRAQLDEVRQGAAATSPEAVQDMLDTMAKERERLQNDKERLSSRLNDIESQLEALGFEGGTVGLAQIIQQLYDQRSALQARTEAMRVERDALLNERRRFEARIRKEEERESQIEAMEAEIRHLAADREAITRHRDQLRSERNEFAEKLDKLKLQRARLLADVSTHKADLEDVRAQLAAVQQQLQAANAEKSTAASERDRLLAERRALQGERDQLMARIEGDRDRLQQLSEEARDEVTSMIEEITAQRDHLERELNNALTALSVAESEQQRLQRQIEQAPPVNGREGNPEMLMGMIEELRTPMTSIIGYVDLLVNESAGIMNEMQRKFIQRISANIVRLQTMLNDLTHLAALDTGQVKLKRQPVDMIQMLEEAITNATYQFREKDLTVDLQLEDDITLQADPDGLTQVIGQLLTNAYLVSPAETNINILAERRRLDRHGTSTDAVFVSITDSGGGIAEDELDEVFARRYRPEHHLISGLGDTGVGLSIAKALVEAHGGQMWVETQEGVGTTFSFALPMNLQPEVETR